MSYGSEVSVRVRVREMDGDLWGTMRVDERGVSVIVSAAVPESRHDELLKHALGHLPTQGHWACGESFCCHW